MTPLARKSLRPLGLALAAVAGIAGLFVGEDLVPLAPNTWISQAEARIGRPLTPLSYAGVARRTTRRAVAGGAVVGGAVVGGAYAGGAYIAAPRVGCYQVVDAYGRSIWRCP